MKSSLESRAVEVVRTLSSFREVIDDGEYGDYSQAVKKMFDLADEIYLELEKLEAVQ